MPRIIKPVMNKRDGGWDHDHRDHDHHDHEHRDHDDRSRHWRDRCWDWCW